MEQREKPDPVERFIAQIDHLEKRYKGHKYADAWLINRDVLIAVRDELKQRKLF
jgi:hypothetical protein